MIQLTHERILEILSSSKVQFTATQKKLSIPIINRISKKMKYGLKFDEIKVFDNQIIDGHHRFVSSIIAEIPLNFKETLKPTFVQKIEWKDVLFVNEEWDTLEKIRNLNEIDASFNNLTIEIIEEIIK